ncbi:hypothetical protein [Leptolyngbya sp. FACHB-261]|uniref:hypothetical protein n=1 Tax=Leptolyngbya sp. FACHB-261 TaxID=2692806 RepID=UPI00168240EA|nr:hypothetical protein [Leptolyngbya sp. FACHB-261]MBD2099500.1 hypothetical protein [Leptolyngbya sp. FACHB-261]
MHKSFLPGAIAAPQVPACSNSPADPTPSREPLRILLIGSRQGIKQTIQRLHLLRFTEIGAWSPALPTAIPGELISILVRHVLGECQTSASRTPWVPSFLDMAPTSTSTGETIKLFLIGSPKAVIETIARLHHLNFADAETWSPLSATGNPGEVMTVLTRLLQA